MSVNEKMTAIADAIRDNSGITEKLTLDDMAINISAVYSNGRVDGYTGGYEEGKALGIEIGKASGIETGKTEENRAFWDVVTAKNTKTNYQMLFRGADFSLIRGGFNPPYTLNPVDNTDNMFRAAKGLTKITKSQLNTSKNLWGNSTFEASDLQEIEEFSVARFNDTNVKWQFYGCSQLHTIGKFILKEDGSQILTKNFIGDDNLQNILIEGLMGTTEDFSACSKLTAKSIESIVSALSGTASGQTLTFHNAVKTTYYNAHSSEYADADAAWDALCNTKPNWTIALV